MRKLKITEKEPEKLKSIESVWLFRDSFDGIGFQYIRSKNDHGKKKGKPDGFPLTNFKKGY